MPKKKSKSKGFEKEPKQCPHCLKWFDTRGLQKHMASCAANPDRQQQSQQSIQQPQPPTISPQLQEKIKNKLDAEKEKERDFILRGLEQKKQQAINENRDLTPQEKVQFQEVYNYIQDQSADQKEIDSNLTTVKKFDSKAKMVKAAEHLEGLNTGQKMDLQSALAFDIITSAQDNRRMNQMYIQEKLNKISEPKETSSSKFQEKLLFQLLEAKQENDLEKFTKTFEMIKSMQSVIGEKEGGSSEVINQIAKSIIPPIVDFGKKVFEKKQGQPNPQQLQNPQQPQEIITENISPNANQINNPNLIEQEQAHVPTQSPAPQPEQFPSDQELLNNPQLRDQYSPLANYPNLQFATDQYLTAPTSTST